VTLYCGVDVGAAATKVVLIDAAGELRAHGVERTGPDTARLAAETRAAVLAASDLAPQTIARTCATGFGRNEVAFAEVTRTEISCHGRGCLHHFPGPMTIVDIGGQDNKIIKLDERGKRLGFKLNRKCAAGTGAFLEEIAAILDVELGEMDRLAGEATDVVRLGSFCTVFTKTEILTNFRRGDRVADIVAGAFESVVRRIVEMDPLAGNVVLTGGVVAHNPYIVGIFERVLGRSAQVPPQPQFTGALGAALVARESV
jgi:predicted CoA-substrate-specific enzyme activase